jgi:hypothetical protein
MESQILALKKVIGISNTNCYFKYQLLLQIPIVTSNTNCYSKYQLLLQIPIVTSNTSCYFKYQLLLQIPIGTLNTNWYFEQPLVTIHQQEQQEQQSGYKSTASTTRSRLKLKLPFSCLKLGRKFVVILAVGRDSAHYIALVIFTCFGAYTIQARFTTKRKHLARNSNCSNVRPWVLFPSNLLYILVASGIKATTDA